MKIRRENLKNLSLAILQAARGKSELGQKASFDCIGLEGTCQML